MKIIKWPIIYVVVQFILMFLMALFYQGDPNLLSTYLVDNKIYLVLLLGIIFIPLLIKNYKKEEKNNINISILIIIGFSFSIIYNICIFYLNKYINITNLYNDNQNIIVTIVSTVLIGPVIEELMFRGIMYNEAKKKFSNLKSILLINTIFALMHADIIQMIYAFIIGFMLIYVYEKYKTIKAPIILHMVSNLTTTLLLPLLIKDYIIINYLLLIFGLFSLFIVKRQGDL